MLPLVQDPDRQYNDGWCTYVYEHTQVPELEVFCGGINAKTPLAGAVWRQGNLLHFGFEPSPADLNDNGRALLVNAIVYISRFADDQPIVRTATRRRDNKRLVDRDCIRRILDNLDRDLVVLEYFASPSVNTVLRGKSRAEMSAWFQEVRGFIHADPQGKLTVDREAQSFGVSPASPEFFAAAAGAIRKQGPKAGLARLLLARYAPTGPADTASADAWDAWWTENEPYAFFSDTGGYRWYVDALAKARRIPSNELRGSERGSE